MPICCTGTYDCVDRIVLNGYFRLGYSPGGFRTWWRNLHQGSDADLDNAHLMRMAGRRRAGGCGAGRRPTTSRLSTVQAGERKDDLVPSYSAQEPGLCRACS